VYNLAPMKHARRLGPAAPPRGASLLRLLPQVEKVLRQPTIEALAARHPRPEVARAVRTVLDGLRRAILSVEKDGGSSAAEGVARAEALARRLEPEGIAREVESRLTERSRPAYRRAINATGIILHTGLGRAVYSESARAAIDAALEGYALVEIDTATGERNRREVHVANLLRELTGAEAATAVNNNAGATLIILAALARGKEVIVSRGQMVEIGGAFRIPDVMEESGAKLVEVGTTNRTYIDDYRRAITPQTGLLLQVHTSNYEITGFARHTPLDELVALGRDHGIAVVSDLGSGCFIDLSPYGFRKEPLVADSVVAGADIVCFSGDKLLGGPQAGLVLGKREAVEKVRSHPLFRALRIDKVTLAGLEATLRIYRDPERAREAIPPLRMIAATVSEIRARASRFLRRLSALQGVEGKLVRTDAQAGSGSLPSQDLPSWAVAVSLKGRTPIETASFLRAAETPVFSRVHGGDVLLDFRTLLPGEEKPLLDAIRFAASG